MIQFRAECSRGREDVEAMHHALLHAVMHVSPGRVVCHARALHATGSSPAPRSGTNSTYSHSSSDQPSIDQSLPCLIYCFSFSSIRDNRRFLSQHNCFCPTQLWVLFVCMEDMVLIIPLMINDSQFESLILILKNG